MRILLVEDDAMLAEAVKAGLEQDAYVVDAVSTGADAQLAVSTHQYDCVLLDLGLPDGDGINVLNMLRKAQNPIPVIIVSARDKLDSKITGLDAGADDYLVKPFDLRELKARIRSAYRRKGGEPPQTLITFGKLTLDCNSLQATYAGVQIDLSAKEFRILQRLAEQKGQLVTREQLENLMYGWGQEVESNAVEVHMHRIRKKTSKHLVINVRSAGYRLNEEL